MYFRFTFIWLHWQTANKKSMLADFLAPRNYFLPWKRPKRRERDSDWKRGSKKELVVQPNVTSQADGLTKHLEF